MVDKASIPSAVLSTPTRGTIEIENEFKSPSDFERAGWEDFILSRTASQALKSAQELVEAVTPGNDAELRDAENKALQEQLKDNIIIMSRVVLLIFCFCALKFIFAPTPPGVSEKI